MLALGITGIAELAGVMKRLLFGCVLCVLSGCGTGYYDELLEQRSRELKMASEFSPLWPGPNEIPGTNLMIRLPKKFEKVYNKTTIYSADANAEIDPERLNPPFMNPFPGLVGCYEAFVKTSTGEGLPIYLYLGIRELVGDAKVAFQQELAGKLKQLDPTADWENIDVPNPKGALVSWKMIEAKMPQVFFPEGKGRADAKTLPGFFQIWWYDVPTGAVLLGWRAADDTSSEMPLRTLARLTAGTLEIKPANAAPPPAPVAADGAAAQP
jgi:hypothetical protein